MAYGINDAMDKTTLYLPAELHVAIREIARRMGRPQAEVMRDALQTFVQEHADRPMPRSIGIANDPELSGADAEDWYRTNFRHE